MPDINILNKIPSIDYTEHYEYYDPEAFENLVNSRRSCRVYTDEPVPEEVMNKCLDLALLAPNSSNLQPWEFYWVKSREKREKLNYYCLNQPTARTAAEIVVVVSRPKMWKKTRKLMLKAFRDQDDIKVPESAIMYYDKLVPLSYNQGPLSSFGFIKRIYLFFAGLSKPVPRKPTSNADMMAWAHKSTALACENLMLAFRAHGFDTCPMEGLDHYRIRKLLELPRSAEVCMAISVGKRADNGIYGPRIRFDRDLFVKKV